MGSNGFLGNSLLENLKDRCVVRGSGRSGALAHDLSRPVSETFLSELKAFSPTHCLVTAAVSDVEKCARNPQETRAINVDGTIQLLKVLRECEVVPVFFSTDYVLRNSSGELPDENAEIFPTTEYGRQKLEVENFLRENFEEHIIFRTSKLMSMSAHPRNILTQVKMSLVNEGKFGALVDQFVTPVFVEDIAEVICRLEKLNGTYHLATRKILSRMEIAEMIRERFSLGGCLFPVKVSEIKTSEPRPNYHVLNSDKIYRELGMIFQEITPETLENI